MSTYSDLNEMARTDPAMLVTDYDAIRQSLSMILATAKGSRWWRPTFGANIEQFLFDPFNEITANKIRLELFSIANGSNGEDRVRLDNIHVDLDTDEQTYVVTLTFGDSVEPMSFVLESYGSA